MAFIFYPILKIYNVFYKLNNKIRKHISFKTILKYVDWRF